LLVAEFCMRSLFLQRRFPVLLVAQSLVP
jgi:hypothetical protein